MVITINLSLSLSLSLVDPWSPVPLLLSTDVTGRIYLASRPHHRADSLGIPPAGRIRWASRPGRIRWASRRLVFFKMMRPACQIFAHDGLIL